MEAQTLTSEPDPTPVADTAAPVVVVGAGPVGMRVVRELRELAPHQHIVIYGEERFEPYNRVHLSGVLAGHRSVVDISLPGLFGATLRRQAVVALEPDQHQVVAADGTRQRYSKLILATGSRPFVPTIPGVTLSGVYTFRDMADAERLAARRVSSTHTVVLGAGLLGIECARAMQRHHTQVTLVDHNPHPMFRQLDSSAGAIVAGELEDQGINLQLGNSLRMVLGTSSVEGVVLRDGTRLSCDTLVLATGITPNRALAQQAGLAFGRGITVDATMQTSDPDIYAIGECCEHDGEVFGLVAPGYEQAAIAARNVAMVGVPEKYVQQSQATSLKAAGLSVFAMGDADPPRSQRTVTWQQGDQYRRVSMVAGRIDSINAVGDWPELPMLREWAGRGRWISPWRLWRFTRSGRLFGDDQVADVHQWPAQAIVCNCNAVSCGQLRQSISEGAGSIEALTARTQAGSGCGSCRPLLQQMLGEEPAAEKPAGFFGLAGLAVAALCIAALALAWSFSYPETVQLEWRWDLLWRDGFNKQVTGFSMLALVLLSLIFSARKRIGALNFGGFDWWRLSHIALTTLALFVLFAHTGFRMGSNLNLLLMGCFVGLVAVGGALGLLIAFEHRLGPMRVRQWRSWCTWGHVLLSWPVPALLGMHVLKTYYF